MKSRIMVLALALLLPFPIAAATFKIATPIPDGTGWMKQMRAAAAEVKQRTDGRVKFRFYPGGVMGNDNSVLRKIKVGQLQGGALTGGGLTAIYPDSQIYSLPFTFQNFDEVDYLRAKMDAGIIDELYRRGYVSFGISEGGFAYLMSQQPVASTADLRGKKVWIPEGDRISQLAFQEFGVSPIQLPLTDVLTGLQTGLVNTVASSTVGAIALQWHTRVKYLTDTPLIYLYGTMIVSRRAFEKLSAQDQATVREVMGELFTRLNRINREDNQKAYQVLQEQGIRLVTMAPADAEALRSGSHRTMDKLSRKGILSPEVLKAFRTYLSEYRQSAGRDAVAAALR